MSYQLIDMTKDPRSGQFAYFRQMLFPFAGVTAEVDITDFAARRQGRPFFLSFLYAVVRAANAVPQLRRRIRADGSVVEYDWCPPSYTAMKPDGVYVYCTVEGDLPYESFVVLGQRRQEEVLRRGTLTEDGDALSFFFVSSLPWLHYSQLEHPAVSADDSNPRISWGKAVTSHGRTTLPVSLFVNHALADGLHISQFFAGLERELQTLMDYYAFERRGIRLLKIEDSWQLCSAPEYADVIRRAFEIRKPAKLSQPALEVLTIIAYYQPTTRAYVDQIRGVDSAYTIGLLLDRKLIEECGRLQVPGRPRLYRTTKQFLRAFHLTSLDDLPELPDLGGEGQMRIGEDGQIMDPADTAEITGADTPETAGAMEEEAP